MKQYAKKSLVVYWVSSVFGALITAVFLRMFIFSLYHVPSGSAEPNLLVGDRIWGNKMAYYFNPVKRGDLVIFDNPEYQYSSANIIIRWWQKYLRIPFSWASIKAGPENWLKRVIALPGDIIEGRVERGKTIIYLKGKKLDEPYVNTFPLVKLKKRVGFKPSGISLFSSVIPAYLEEVEKEVDYSYDPLKSFLDQPFYSMTENEIVRTVFSKDLILTQPFTPTYVMQNSFCGTIDCVDSFGPIVIPKGKYWVMGDSRKNSRDSRYWGLLDRDLIHGRASFIIYSIDGEESCWFFDFLKHPISFFTKKVRWKRFFSRLDYFNGTVAG